MRRTGGRDGVPAQDLEDERVEVRERVPVVEVGETARPDDGVELSLRFAERVRVQGERDERGEHRDERL